MSYRGTSYNKKTTRSSPYHKKARCISLPHFYSKYLTRTLTQLFEDAKDLPPEEHFRLIDELTLLRDVSAQAVRLYGVARDAYESKHEKASIDTVLQAGSVMAEHLREVGRMVEQAARVQAMCKEVVPVNALQFFVEQVVRCAHEAFGDDERVKDFEYKVRAKIRIPKTTTDGTLLTPDQDAIDMDASVPKGPT